MSSRTMWRFFGAMHGTAVRSEQLRRVAQRSKVNFNLTPFRVPHTRSDPHSLHWDSDLTRPDRQKPSYLWV
jgi:hypothetical protein